VVKEKQLQAEINIGMIGHVDHGKTSLVQSLTGKWTDTHSEEIKKGISIRLGYADALFYKCENCNGRTAYSNKEMFEECGKKGSVSRKVSFVDAPGHETLMATMLSGATLMQGAVLVISAAEECPQPRTIEHLAALSITGVKDVIVAQNKIDLVSKEQAMKNYEQINDFLKSNGFENATVIPTAANFGTNVDMLIEEIETKIKTPKYELDVPLKMYGVRSFDTNRPGTKPKDIEGGVIGGSIIQGKIKKGDKIELSPGIDGQKMVTKVVDLSVADGKIESAQPGGLIALRTELDPSITKGDQLRGQLIGKPGTLPEPVGDLKLEVYEFERLLGKNVGMPKANEMVVLTIGTATVVGVVAKQLKKNEYEIKVKGKAAAEPKQKVAISKRVGAGWRLASYGIIK